jgi:hypothetical protein
MWTLFNIQLLMILSSWNKRNCMVHIERIIVLSSFNCVHRNFDNLGKLHYAFSVTRFCGCKQNGHGCRLPTSIVRNSLHLMKR